MPHNDLETLRLAYCAPPTVSTIPRGPSIKEITPRTASGLLIAEWRAPLDDGGSSITAYDLRYIETSSDETVDSNWTVVQNVWTTGAGVLRYRLSGLVDGTEYDLQVRAENSEGHGPWSPPVTGTPEEPSVCVTGGAVADVKNTGLVSDCEILLDIRDTLAGSTTLNWAKGTPIANWEGVGLRGSPQRVTLLELSRRGLTGSLPPDLDGLDNLAILYLSSNRLTGEIPAELGNLSNLGVLYLHLNQIFGEIPPEIGNLENLRRLILGDNQLTGEIPASLGRLLELEGLSLDGNQLTGQIPSELGDLEDLDGLALNDNQLEGEIPTELGNLVDLGFLNISDNRFSGEIPAELGKLVNLKRLYLSSNQLTGQIPTELGKLVSLSSLRLGDNQLSGCIPPALNRVPTNDLPSLSLPYCEVTIPRAPSISEVISGTGTGILILEWSAPSSDGGSDITAYDVRYIESSSDKTVDANWTVVQDVWSGTGSGTLSYELQGLRQGTQYDLQVRAVNSEGDGPWSSSFTGTPAAPSVCVTGRAVADLRSAGLMSDCEILLKMRDTLAGIATLNWSANVPITKWEGIILGGTPSRVTELQLGSFGLTGSIPSDIGGLTALTVLALWQNDLTGVIPPELGNLPNLIWVYLQRNQLDGDIPSELANLANLERLYLNNNALTGDIPAELGRLSKLEDLALNTNQLAGTITLDLVDLVNLKFLYLGGNNLTGAIPAELGDHANLQTLGLGGNRLTGEIPDELSTLVELKHLVLQYNRLTGEIPPELGRLSKLQTLTLTENRLTGEIPRELGNLSELHHLNLRRTRLSGCIPPELQDPPINDVGSLNLPFCEVTIPLPPSISRVLSAIDSGSLKVEWDAPLRDGGSDITAYNLRFIRTSDDETVDSNWTVVQDVWTYESDSFQYALGGLADDAQYDVQLRAVNALGEGLWSTTATGTTAEGSNCTTNSAVPVAASNPGLVADCEALLEALDSLVGGGSLNWTADTPMSQWEGVSLSGTPQRVTRLVLPQQGLTGTIPAALGRLSMLTEMDLRNNQLTGEIPTELGEHTSLQELYLSGNQLTGCIPEALRDVSTSDLDELSLPYCDVLLDALAISPGSLIPAFDPYLIDYVVLTSSSRVTVTPISEKGATIRFLDQNENEITDVDGSLDDHQVDLETPITDIMIVVTSLDGRTTHIYTLMIRRVPGPPNISDVTSGDGQLIVTWTPPDETDGIDISAYDLRYIETAADETVDSNWTVVEDVWTKGNGDLRYTLTGLKGDSEYDIQVRAVNAGGEGPWSATVTGMPTTPSVCVTGGAVADATNAGLISDCEALLEARDTLAGNGSLDWSSNTPIAQWDGVGLGGTPQRRVTRLNLPGKGLSGTIPSVLGRLSMLTHLNLRSNDGLTGEIPAELGRLSNLRVLNLHSNSHAGTIPDLSGATMLQELYLPNNADYNADGSKVQGSGLTGGIPTWLNGMTNMRELWLWGNSLTGLIPDLSGMTSLDKLKLANNNLTGGVPEASELPTNMTWLIIDRNPLGGEIPDLSSLSRLRLLWLHSNELTGSLPAGDMFPASLDDLNLRDNMLTGEISDLSLLDNLTRLRLHNNSLSGEVPATLGGLDSLKYLWLHNEDATKTDKGNNMLTSIAAGVGGLGDTLIVIALNGNPWDGDACVPAGLANVAKNDYTAAGVEVCAANDSS